MLGDNGTWSHVLGCGINNKGINRDVFFFVGLRRKKKSQASGEILDGCICKLKVTQRPFKVKGPILWKVRFSFFLIIKQA